MATKIKAVETIIEWDEELYRMAILNPGDTAEVGDGLAATKINCGHAEEVSEPAPADEPKKGRGKGKAAAPSEPAPADDASADEDGAPV